MTEHAKPQRHRPVIRASKPLDPTSEDEYKAFLEKANKAKLGSREAASKLKELEEVMRAAAVDKEKAEAKAENEQEVAEKTEAAKRGVTPTTRRKKIPPREVLDSDEPTAAESEVAARWADDPDNPYAYMRYKGTPTDNPQFREEVDSRCKEIDWSGILEGTAKQEVPILPSGLTVVYQTIAGDVRLFIDDLWGKEAVGKTEFYANNLAMMYSLAASVVSINGNPLPRLKRLDDGSVDADSFDARYKRIKTQGEELLDLLATNHLWFRHRVMWRIRKGDVGNG